MADNYVIFHSQYSAEQLELAKQNQVPRINPTTQRWERWDIATMQWVDTGIRAAGSLSTDVNGLLKGEGGIVVQAVAGVDYPTVAQVEGKYTKPDGGIPDSDIASVGAGKVSGTLGVAHGGTGATTLASGQALIGNGTGAVQTRGINDATSDAQLADNNNLVTSRAVRHNSNYYLNRTNRVSDANANYSTYMARGESLNPADTIPLQNGQIAWTYE